MNLKNVPVFVVVLTTSGSYEIPEVAFTYIEDARRFIGSKRDGLRRWIAEVVLTGKLPIIPVDYMVQVNQIRYGGVR